VLCRRDLLGRNILAERDTNDTYLFPIRKMIREIKSCHGIAHRHRERLSTAKKYHVEEPVPGPSSSSRKSFRV